MFSNLDPHIIIHVSVDWQSGGFDGSVWAQECCRISPPYFLAECRKRRLNQGSFVLFCCVWLFAYSELYLICAFYVVNEPLG